MNFKTRTEFWRRGRCVQDLVFEPLEPRTLLAGGPILSDQPLIISEFAADNNSTLLTRTRSSTLDPFEGVVESPDWIEMLNISDQRLGIGGMHLTDDVANPTKWQFPAGTSIDAGAFLVVFASGRDISDPSLDEHGFLHTNFRLNSGGEYLALINRDGAVVHEFSPTFPAQRTDVSYSVPMKVRTLLGPDASLEYLVPTDDSLEPQWRLPGFTHANMISKSNPASPVGFDRGGGPVEQAETIGAELADRSSVDFSRGSIVVLESMPFTTAGRVAQWSFYSEKTSSITPLIFRARDDEFEIVGVGRTRTSDGSGTQTFAFDLQSGSDAVESAGYFFGFKDGDNQTDDPGAVVWSRSDSDTVRRYNGPLSGNVIIDQQLTGGRAFGRTFSLQATTGARLAGPINTNVQAAMSNATSLYVRYPFAAEQFDTLQSLRLHVRYDDGFVAYLNGTEVARRNVPETVRFDSTAASNQPLKDANRFEEINISQFIGELIEGQNVLALHGLNDDRDSSEFLIDAQLVGLDIQSVSDVGFASDPTPGSTSGVIFRDFVSAPSFSHSRGFYDEPFTLQLATPATPDATTYFTTDRTDPAPGNPTATLYENPLPIDSTTVLRAASYQDGRLPSLPQTHTYIFPHDVAIQSTLQPAITDDPVWGPQVTDALQALPTISLVTPDSISVAGEVGTSVELIFPDGTDGFQVDAGVEPTGGTSLAFAKQSLRLSFKKIYGPSTLEFDLYDDPDGVTEFDQLLLRSGSQDSLFVIDPNVGGSSYIRNRWAYDRQLEMGQPAPRGRFVHLYLNGTYWGQYHLMERPNAAFMASNFGGDKTDYDVLNAGKPIGGSGDIVAWNALIDAVDDGYDAVGSYLDVVNYADYMLLQFFGGNDWDWRADFNWIAARTREPGAGFQFFAWDSDNMLRRGANSNVVNFGSPGFLWTLNGGVQQYPEFLRLLAGRAQKYFFDGGMFTNQRLRSDIDALAEQIRVSIIAESARWGSGLYTPAMWEAAIDWIQETLTPENGPSRAAIVIEQMRLAGVFPLSDRPQFLVDGQPLEGNRVAADAVLTMTAPQGVIYYTLDGSDPWEETPTVEYTTLIEPTAPARVLVPLDNTWLSDWLAPEFDDSNWIRGENGIGYDVNGEFTPLIGLNVQEQMKDVNATAYLRLPFQVDDPSQFDTLQLSMRYDDGFVAYLNGVEVARRNAPETLTWNSHASRVRTNVEAIGFENFNLSRVKHLLEPGENLLAIHALNVDPANVDFLMTPMLQAGTVTDTGVSPAAVRYSDPITVPPDANIKARTIWGDQWSTLRQAVTATPTFPLRISEVMYHPAEPTEAEQSAGFSDADDFEFVELINISNASIDLADFQLVQTTVGEQTEGVEFDLAKGLVKQLAPGQHVLVVENVSAFRARYGNDLPVAGQWSGGLSNRSETVTFAVNEIIVQQFAYDDAWYASTDGQGSSLELIDVRNTPVDEYGNPQRWRASQVTGGTPGRAAGEAALPGDANGDGRFNPADLDQVLAAGKYQTGQAATFEQGDWNGDGVFNSHDIVHALIRGDFQSAGGLAFTARAGSPERGPSRSSSRAIRDQSFPDGPSGDLTDRAIAEIFDKVS